jgi:hypothetical protein
MRLCPVFLCDAQVERLPQDLFPLCSRKSHLRLLIAFCPIWRSRRSDSPEIRIRVPVLLLLPLSGR